MTPNLDAHFYCVQLVFFFFSFLLWRAKALWKKRARERERERWVQGMKGECLSLTRGCSDSRVTIGTIRYPTYFAYDFYI